MNKKQIILIFSRCLVLTLGILLIFFIKEYRASRTLIDLNYLDTALPVDERIQNLLAQMTLEEKIGQMALIEKDSIRDIDDIHQYGLGGILSGGGATPKDNTANGWFEMVNEFVEDSRSSRLGIPILYGVDAVHGHNNVPEATIFPHAIGLGATHNPELVQKVAEATAQEVKATGVSWVFSPNLDAPEDIRWGRVYETFSSDSQTNANLGSVYIQGLQGAATNSISVVATAKHFLGAGGMKWGSSSGKDYKIDQGTTDDNEEVLREFYLPPFKSAVDAGVLSVMVGLNSFGDKKSSANAYLITDVLKNELGFKGFVVSDWYGVYEIPGGKYVATVTAINAGVDMLMLPYDYKPFIAHVKKAIIDKDISEERIDDAVARILRAKFAVGLFEPAKVKNLDIIGSKENRALAREAVSQSLVLLQNRNQTVPFLNVPQKIYVAGSSADNTGRQSGGWTIQWQGVDGNQIPGATSIFKGIKEVVGTQSQVVYDEKALFVEDDLADVGIAIVGEKPYAEGWGDTEDVTLSAEDLATIASLRKVSKKLVVIIVSGRPLILPTESKEWDAIIAAWLPGSEGAGVADVLFGTKTFTGKLSIPWPANLRQIPFSPDGISADKTKPLFPRGFGL